MTTTEEARSPFLPIQRLEVPLAYLVTIFRLRAFLRNSAAARSIHTERFGDIRYKEGIVFFWAEQFSVVDGPCGPIMRRLCDNYFVILPGYVIHEVSIGQDGRCYACAGGTLRLSEFKFAQISLENRLVIVVDQIFPSEYTQIFSQSIQALLNSVDGLG